VQAAEAQIVSLPVAGSDIPAGAIVVPEAVIVAREEPAAVPSSGPEIVAALAPDLAPATATEPSTAAAAPTSLAVQPLAPLAAPSAAPAPVTLLPISPAPVVEPTAQGAPLSSSPADAVAASREPSVIVAGIAEEANASTVLAPVEDEAGSDSAGSQAPAGTPNAAPADAGTQIAAALPRPDPQAPLAPGPARPMAMAAFLKGYEGDGCVLALPAGDGTVQAFADRPDKAEQLRAAYFEETGSDLSVEPRQVTKGQCGALSFSRSLPQYPNYSLTIDLISSAIDSGEALSGRVEGRLKNTLYLLVVDDEGKARLVRTYQGVTKLSVPFSAPMVLKNSVAAPVQLLVAIASDGPLDTAQVTDGMTADSFFNDLAWEIVSEQRRISFGIAGFVVR
jgi:hypothetical protein